MPIQAKQDVALAHWRALRGALNVVGLEAEAEYVTCGAEAFALYRALTPAKKRAKMPGPPTTASEFSTQSRVWHQLLTKEAQAQIGPALDVMVKRLRALDDRVVEARKALRAAAKVVPSAVVGEGAAWRMIRADWLSQNGSPTAHRAHAELTAHDLLSLGYEVRCISRLKPSGCSIRAFEVWAWTCEEGAQIAVYQTPKGEVPEPPLRWVPLAVDEEVRT